MEPNSEVGRAWRGPPGAALSRAAARAPDSAARGGGGREGFSLAPCRRVPTAAVAKRWTGKERQRAVGPNTKSRP